MGRLGVDGVGNVGGAIVRLFWVLVGFSDRILILVACGLEGGREGGIVVSELCGSFILCRKIELFFLFGCLADDEWLLIVLELRKKFVLW